MTSQKINRRTAIGSIAIGLGSLFFPPTLSAENIKVQSGWRKWEGEVFGAASGIEFQMDDKDIADAIIAKSIAEIHRIESIFSLQKANSQINKLNSQGYLDNPASELVSLLRLSKNIHDSTNGAFDITVQPLWSVYSNHFWRKDKKKVTTPPDPSMVQAALGLVNQAEVHITDHRISFEKPKMGITLNGIAQGFATDHIVKILKKNGIKNMFVDLGEMSATGYNSKNKRWTAGILDPTSPFQIIGEVELADMALATSGSYGLEFDDKGISSHIFNPKTGHSPRYYQSVSVVAQSAAIADALSTALNIIPENKIAKSIKKYKAGVLVIRLDGSKKIYGSFPQINPV